MSNLDMFKNKNWNLPTVCPKCGAPLELNDNHTRLFCTADDCPSKIGGRIVRYAALLDFRGFGPAVANDLIQVGCSNISDIYSKVDSLIQLDGYGARSIEKLKKYLTKKKEVKLPLFLSAYGIRGFGEKTIEKIVGEDATLESIRNQKPTAIKGVGIERVTEFLDSFNKMFEDICKCAEHFEFVKPAPKVEGGKLSGLSFCFTGKACMPRPQLEKIVVENGGTISAVKKGLSYLVTDDTESGSAKNKKAKELGIPVVDSQSFLAMVN